MNECHKKFMYNNTLVTLVGDVSYTPSKEYMEVYDEESGNKYNVPTKDLIPVPELKLIDIKVVEKKNFKKKTEPKKETPKKKVKKESIESRLDGFLEEKKPSKNRFSKKDEEVDKDDDELTFRNTKPEDIKKFKKLLGKKENKKNDVMHKESLTNRIKTYLEEKRK